MRVRHVHQINIWAERDPVRCDQVSYERSTQTIAIKPIQTAELSQSFWLPAAKLCCEVRVFRAFRLHAEPQTRLYWA